MEARAIILCLFLEICLELGKKNTVNINGFGRFKPVMTHQSWKLRPWVFFKPGSNLKSMMAKLTDEMNASS